MVRVNCQNGDGGGSWVSDLAAEHCNVDEPSIDSRWVVHTNLGDDRAYEHMFATMPKVGTPSWRPSDTTPSKMATCIWKYSAGDIAQKCHCGCVIHRNCPWLLQKWGLHSPQKMAFTMISCLWLILPRYCVQANSVEWDSLIECWQTTSSARSTHHHDNANRVASAKLHSDWQ